MIRFQNRSKYGAVRVETDGVKFASKSEEAFYQMLKLDPAVLHIDCHVPVTLPGGVRYALDFLVWKKDGPPEAIEVKGFVTQGFRIQRKLFDQFHPLSPLRVFKRMRGKWHSI